MTLIILTGRLGVGKSTVQTSLLELYGVSVVNSYTTRPTSAGDPGVVHIEPIEFMVMHSEGRLCAPIRFGGDWYGWMSSDIVTATTNRAFKASVTARPYTALLLGSVLQNCLVVHLAVEEEELSKRRSLRASERDTGPIASSRLAADDAEFVAYETLLPDQVRADSEAASWIMKLMG